MRIDEQLIPDRSSKWTTRDKLEALQEQAESD
jgi:hypothetical protein